MIDDDRCKVCKMSGLTPTEKLHGLCSYCLEESEEEDISCSSKCNCSEKRAAFGGCSKCNPGFWEDYGDDFPLGTCNPDAPEECESCQ